MSCVKPLKDLGSQLFDKRGGLLNFWQHSAENFYPERADFTMTKNQGADFSIDMMSSYPMRARRDLGNILGSMLRSNDWFSMRTNRQDEDTLGKQWLENATTIQSRAMTDRVANFSRATKEGDHDIAAFGQCVISAEVDMNANALLYRCWHLRDVAWMENYAGKITTVFRKWRPSVQELVKKFPNTVSAKTREKLAKRPFDEVVVWHCIMPAEDYMSIPGVKPVRQPYVSIYLEIDSDSELECIGSVIQPYTIPRWQTVQGSQYAVSPAVTASISDARAMQVMMQTVMSAGEMAINPPMIGYPQSFSGGLQLFAGGFTAIDREYDERTGDPVHALDLGGKTGMPIGLELLDRTRMEISEAWFLNKLNLPPQGGAMTATEIMQRVQEFVRSAMPLIDPLEAEYNAALCENTFTLLMSNGAFGNPAEIPPSIQGADVQFVFQSPLQEGKDKIKGNKLLEFVNLVGAASQIDPDAAIVLDVKEALRDSGHGTVPASWLRPKEAVEAILAQQQAANEQQVELANTQQVAEIAKTAKEARA